MDEVIVMTQLTPRLNPVFFTVLCILAWTVTPAAAYQPQQAVSPDDISRQRAVSDFSSDWSATDQFDLTSATELRVSIQNVEVPVAGGLALLVFTLELPPEVRQQVRWDANQRYFATLQISDVVARKGFTRRSFGRGKNAILRGWAPTELNNTGSMMLVSEIELASGRIYRFHNDNPRMR
jgi:hypothetical protein